MGEIRSWKVRSNSFRPDYDIAGADLRDAVASCMGRILADALPVGGRWRPRRVSGEWIGSIRGGLGGVEIAIEAVGPHGAVSCYPVWIAAAAADLDGRASWDPPAG
jgi:hypothetical protein